MGSLNLKKIFPTKQRSYIHIYTTRQQTLKNLNIADALRSKETTEYQEAHKVKVNHLRENVHLLRPKLENVASKLQLNPKNFVLMNKQKMNQVKLKILFLQCLRKTRGLKRRSVRRIEYEDEELDLRIEAPPCKLFNKLAGDLVIESDRDFAISNSDDEFVQVVQKVENDRKTFVRVTEVSIVCNKKSVEVIEEAWQADSGTVGIIDDDMISDSSSLIVETKAPIAPPPSARSCSGSPIIK